MDDKTEGFRAKLHEVIFEADTKAGKRFDLALLGLILLSVAVVMLETIPTLHERYFHWFYAIEWFFTVIFTIEYLLRLYVVNAPLRYAKSTFGLIDLVSILPTYLSLFVAGSQTLLVVRILRLLRVFRILRMGRFLWAGHIISRALKASRHKLVVFVFFVAQLVIIIGAVMYFVEGPSNDGFSSIPQSIYWAVVTLTTVGFGDVTPETPFGKFLATLVMVIGYAIIAVPTGIVSAELVANQKQNNTQVCRHCSQEGHDDDATHCKYCGWKLFE
ncbi:MAG: ion transporter [Saprospiraceae bacterium]|nr:ion transporter [Saprospiraceae bacterium]